MTEKTEKKVDPKRVMVGSPEFPARFSYAWFINPKVDSEKIDKKTGQPVQKYQGMIIVPKEDKAGVARINAAIDAAAQEVLKGKQVPRTWSMPLRDGDEEWEEKGEYLKGHWFFNCSSKQKPKVVGTERDIEDKLIPLTEDDFKSGDYGRVTINFYYFENESKGIAAGLNNVQKLKDGEALGGGRSSAEDDFGDLEEGFAD